VRIEDFSFWHHTSWRAIDELTAEATNREEEQIEQDIKEERIPAHQN